jgi:regulator of RNase E activity RraA
MTHLESLARLRVLGTTSVSDALDRLGIAGQCSGLVALDPSFRLAGTAFTVRYAPTQPGVGTVGDFVDDVPAGEVVVIDNQGKLDATVWGDLLTFTAARRGIAGTVIDGVCRDIQRSLDLSYPIFSRGNWMRTGKDRVRMEAIAEPVTIGGVRVDHGDFVLGDADGVVAIPTPSVLAVLEVAEEINMAEDRIRDAVARGTSLENARAEFGYHGLQSRIDPR